MKYAIAIIATLLLSGCALDFCADSGVCIVPAEGEPATDSVAPLCESVIWGDAINAVHDVANVNTVSLCGSRNANGHQCATCTFQWLDVCNVSNWNPFPGCTSTTWVPPGAAPTNGCQLAAGTTTSDIIICFDSCDGIPCYAF